MNKTQTIWMGIGIFERLYSEDKISAYFSALDRLPNKKVLLLADEISGCNDFVLMGKKFDRKKDASLLKKYKIKSRKKFKPKYDAIKLLIESSTHPNRWKVCHWDFLSANKQYQLLLNQLRDGMEKFENHYLKQEVLKTTIFGFGARLRKNFTASFVDFVFDKNFYLFLETLSQYTLEEIAATLFLAKNNWIKAGHEEEKPYDELTRLCHERFKNNFLSSASSLEFYYI